MSPGSELHMLQRICLLIELAPVECEEGRPGLRALLGQFRRL